jgi:two-component system phosphate regulon sensor histidine kinase PhoR
MVFVTLLLVELFTQIDISKITYSVIPIISTILSFVIFTYFIDRFINKKIRHIYSIIDTGQISQEPDIKLSDDSLGQLTHATAEWSEAQKKQISDLKKQADFRKEFLGNLAHELKTPIFSIEGYNRLLISSRFYRAFANYKFILIAQLDALVIKDELEFSLSIRKLCSK